MWGVPPNPPSIKTVQSLIHTAIPPPHYFPWWYTCWHNAPFFTGVTFYTNLILLVVLFITNVGKRYPDPYLSLYLWSKFLQSRGGHMHWPPSPGSDTSSSNVSYQATWWSYHTVPCPYIIVDPWWVSSLLIPLVTYWSIFHWGCNFPSVDGKLDLFPYQCHTYLYQHRYSGVEPIYVCLICGISSLVRSTKKLLLPGRTVVNLHFEFKLVQHLFECLD